MHGHSGSYIILILGILEDQIDIVVFHLTDGTKIGHMVNMGCGMEDMGALF